MVTKLRIRQILTFCYRSMFAVHPFEVQASLTNRCDYRCIFCDCAKLKMPEMDLEQWRRTIRALAGAGTLRIKFQGGEPTLRQDFKEISREVKEQGIISGVVTHGGNIAKDPGLLEYLDEVVFSLDAMEPSVHDSLRGAGSFSRAVKAIDYALENGRKVFVNMMACRRTLDQMEAVLAFCEQRNIGFHAQPHYLGWGYANKEQAELSLTDGEIRDMHVRLAGWKAEGRPVMFAEETYLGVTEWSDYGEFTRKTRAGRSSCMAGKSYIHIEPDGSVHPCGVHGADYTPRNIALDGFREAVKHARNHNCADCWIAYLNERKALFGLRPYAVKALFLRDSIRKNG